MSAREPQRVRVGSVELAFETFGQPGDPPVVLVMGLGAQLLYWHEEFCAELAGRGLFVIRFDNRDVGLSTHFSDAGVPDLMATRAPESLPYTMSDMAADVVGLIHAVGLSSAHVVGVSLGGMIAQTVAIEHPDAVRSLVSISSTTGDPTVGQAQPEALAALFTPPSEATREAIGEHGLKLSRIIGSTGFALDEAWLRERAERAFDRAYDPASAMRQAATIAASGDRTPGLRAVTAPTLVIHGTADPLVAPSGGRATADAVGGAELLLIDGMGHDIPRGVWSQVGDAIERTVSAGESRDAAADAVS